MNELKPYLNALLVDEANGIYWTVDRDPEHPRAKAPYRLLRAETVTVIPTSYYQRSPERRWKEFKFWESTGHLNSTAVLEIIRRWNLRRVEVSNGYPEAYAALIAEADRRNLPRDYRDDLIVHDRAALTSPAWAHDKFLWLLRTSGTHIVGLQPDKLDLSPGNSPAEMVKALGQFGDTERLWYYWDGSKLREIDFKRALSLADEAMQDARNLQRSVKTA